MNSIATDIIKSLEQAVEIKNGFLEEKVIRYEASDVKAIKRKVTCKSKSSDNSNRG